MESRAGAGIRVQKEDKIHTQGSCSMVPEVEDKEGLSSSKSVTKKVPQQANPGLAKGMTMPKEKVLEVDMRKATSALPAEESTDQTKPEAANVTLTPDQSSETATRRAALDKAPSEETVEEAPVHQATSEAATGAVVMHPTTSEEAEGGAELIQTPQASYTENQFPAASPVLGATALLSPSQLTGDPGTLELGGEALVRPTAPREREEGQEWDFSDASFPVCPGDPGTSGPRRGEPTRRGSWRSGCG